MALSNRTTTCLRDAGRSELDGRSRLLGLLGLLGFLGNACFAIFIQLIKRYQPIEAQPRTFCLTVSGAVVVIKNNNRRSQQIKIMSHIRKEKSNSRYFL